MYKSTIFFMDTGGNSDSECTAHSMWNPKYKKSKNVYFGIHILIYVNRRFSK